MRTATRRKFYGRSAIAASLRTALNQLTQVIEANEKPPDTPLEAQLGNIIKELETAIEFHKLYTAQWKRLGGKLRKEKEHLAALLNEVMEVPVLPEEKLLNKRKAATKQRDTSFPSNSLNERSRKWKLNMQK